MVVHNSFILTDLDSQLKVSAERPLGASVFSDAVRMTEVCQTGPDSPSRLWASATSGADCYWRMCRVFLSRTTGLGGLV